MQLGAGLHGLWNDEGRGVQIKFIVCFGIRLFSYLVMIGSSASGGGRCRWKPVVRALRRHGRRRTTVGQQRDKAITVGRNFVS